MSLILDGSAGVTFPDVSTQAKAGLVAGGTIATGTVTVLSTNGVAFPATQSPSSDANTLDDYEEGTWTPTVGGSSVPGTATYSVQVGKYTKVGRMVTATFEITTTSTLSGSTGVVLLSGLPFASVNTGQLGNGFGSIGYVNASAVATYTSNLYSDQGTTYVVPVYVNNSSGISYWTAAYFQNSTTFSGGFTYFTT